MPSFRQRLFEALSQLAAVVLTSCTSSPAAADEMLSSWAYRNRAKYPFAERWINWLFCDPLHCKTSYEWEKAHYKVERFGS